MHDAEPALAEIAAELELVKVDLAVVNGRRRHWHAVRCDAATATAELQPFVVVDLLLVLFEVVEVAGLVHHVAEVEAVADEDDVRGAPRDSRRDDLKTLARLCQELALMRQQLEERESMQSTVLYAALAVVLVLLIVVTQAFFKLQHATECLLWYARK